MSVRNVWCLYSPCNVSTHCLMPVLAVHVWYYMSLMVTMTCACSLRNITYNIWHITYWAARSRLVSNCTECCSLGTISLHMYTWDGCLLRERKVRKSYHMDIKNKTCYIHSEWFCNARTGLCSLVCPDVSCCLPAQRCSVHRHRTNRVCSCRLRSWNIFLLISYILQYMTCAVSIKQSSHRR